MADEKQGKPEGKIDLSLKPELQKRAFDTLYSDFTHLGFNYAGFKFTFNVVFDRTEEGAAIIEPQATVCVSPEHAFQIHMLLSGQLREYQEKYGPIRTEPEYLKKDREESIKKDREESKG